MLDSGFDDDSVSATIKDRVRDLLRDARAAKVTGNWKLTLALANAVLALDPANGAAASLVGGPARRRQMTLLFCDIVGSTQIADDRDPEDVSALLRAYRATCTEVIDHYGGFIDDHRGDGMLVLFGYPQVHEDDARRAVQCGLAIVDTLPPSLRARGGAGGDLPLPVRIAIHTDLVVLDGVGVAGATANEAARMQELAAPDTVLISDATKSLVWPYFETVSIGQFTLRGVSRPVELFTVLRNRVSGHREVPVSPFVGREQELAVLRAFLAGPDQGLVISGPPGVGKSRLVMEASRQFDLPYIECNCSRFHRNTSLHPFRAVIEDACQIAEHDGPETRLTKLRARTPQPDQEDAQDLPFLATALDIPLNLLSPAVNVNPSRLRERALQVAAELIGSAAAAGSSRVLFIDDVQWADQSSLDLIRLLTLSAPPGLRILLTTRDAVEAPAPLAALRQLTVDPLSRASMSDLAAQLPDGAGLATEDRDELIERSDGIPLYLEELLRTADDVGSGRIVHRSVRFGDYQIPPALRDPLLARLASPQVDLELAQVAATIGREVDQDLLRRMAGGDDAEFAARLNTLFAAGLLESSQAGIRFRHELIREVAYETQRKSTQRQNHSAIADDLTSGAAGMTRRMSGDAADHLERAHRYPEAVAAHLQVAAADQAVGAHVEATNRLSHTLELVSLLPPGREQQLTELQVRGMRSFSAVMAGGYAAAEAAIDYERSRELCSALAGAPEIVPTLINSWSYYAMRGDLDSADKVSDAMVRECAQVGNDFPAAEVGNGTVDFFRGRFGESRGRLEDFVRSGWGDLPARPPTTWPLPNDPLVAIGAHLAVIRWVEGGPTAAAEWIRASLARCDDLDFPYGPFSSCYVDHFHGLIKNLEGDYVGLAEIGGKMLRAGERHGFAMWQLTAALHLGVSAVHLGRHDAVDQLAEHVSLSRVALASDVHTPYWLTQLALAQDVAGRPDEALASLDQALEVAASTGSEFFTAETLRARGRLLHQRGDPEGARQLAAAVALAERQRAPIFRERAARTLAEATSG